MAIEQRAWESWKTKNSAFYRTTLLDSAVYLGGTGPNTREQIAKQVDDLPCSVDQFTLEHPSAVMLGRDAALLTVKSTMTLTCPNGAPSTSSAWGSTVFVRKDGVWRIALHQESNIKPPKK